MNPEVPISILKGIGPKTEALFHAAGIYTVYDLLFYFPRTYERYPEIREISELIPGRKNAVSVRVKNQPTVNRNSRMQTAVLDVRADDAFLRILWFRSPYIRSVVKPGQTYVFYGRVSLKNNVLTMEQPEVLFPEKYEEQRKTLQPVYSLTKGLTNHQVQKAVEQALSDLPPELEYLPGDIRARNHLSEYNYALKNIHRPADEKSCILARERFVFDEFFFFLLCMQLTKEESASLANRFHFAEADFVDSLIKKLPYRLTGAQQRAITQIQSDLRSGKVMQRLLQGDVGSGKTIVAFLAMLECANSGYQSAIMAPTDVLARQHYQRLSQLCESLGLRYPIVLLTGSLGTRERREAYDVIDCTPNALIVGTHALIQEKVNYHNLALVVTDEQHRFGVKQRENLSLKGNCPHILVMSATPIPRTLAIILYGDLDISAIDEVPAKRKPVKNCVVDTSFREKAYHFMEDQIRKGHQVYIICPFVEATELSEGENVLDYTSYLRTVFPEDIQIFSLHGRMKADEKNRIMEDFLANRIQILVSTTVIEVGVDVSNATVMMIENAERFGLAQLHQLRGRVGRGDAQSYCIFMQGEEQREENRRLAVLNRSNDGFAIAAEDLKLRGPGDFFGIRQSGDFHFQLADIYQDAEVMSRASREVTELLRKDPKLSGEEYRVLRERLKRYAGEDFALLNL